MYRQKWMIAHVMLTLLCLIGVAGLAVRERQISAVIDRLDNSPIVDRSLRGYLGIRQLIGEFKPPKEANHLAIVGFQIEDGKVLKRWPRWDWSRNQNNSEIIPYDITWEPGKKKIIAQGMTTNSDFFTHLDGMWAVAYTNEGFGDFENVRIFTKATSQEPRGDHQYLDLSNSQIENSIIKHRRIFALGYRVFTTADEAKNFINSIR